MIALVEQPYTCTHCGKSFMKERTAMTHICERKRRFLQKDEKRVQAGFAAFNRFWQLTQNAKKLKSYDEFCNSAYYNAFVRFGSFINNVNPLYPDKFIDFVIKSGVKLDHWCKDELYEQYLYEMIKIEPVESAVQRSLQTMMEWADSHRATFSHYFLYASVNAVVHDILNGKISPWVILNSDSAKDIIKSMSDEQLNLIAPAFDVPFWLKKFKEKPADVVLVLEILKEVNIK
jgi:hypothetical protein